MNLIFRLRVYLAGIFYDLAMWVAPPVPARPFKLPEVITVPDPWDGTPRVIFRVPAAIRVPEHKNPRPH